MTRTGFLWRLAISFGIDIADFTIGRTLPLVPWEEGVGAAILVALWGPMGLLYLGEIAEFTEQFDAFIPTATVIALIVGWQKGLLFPKKSKDGESPKALP